MEEKRILTSYPFSLAEADPKIAMELLENGVRFVETKTNANGTVEHIYSVPNTELALKMEEILALKDEVVDWLLLLREETFDVGFVAKVIRFNGMPKDERLCTILLRRLRIAAKLNVYKSYLELCEYAPAFNKKYGENVLYFILKKAGISDGKNINNQVINALNKGKIEEDEAELILYAFPLVSREFCIDELNTSKANDVLK